MKAKIWNLRIWISEVNPQKLRKTLNDLLIRADFDILRFNEYFFQPQGYSALWLLGESHLAIHTFPEENATYLELSSCVEKPFEKFRELLFFEYKGKYLGDKAEPHNFSPMSGRKRN